MNALIPSFVSTPMLRGSAVRQLPRHAALWVVAQGVAAALTSVVGLWSSQPELALTLCIAVGAAFASPQKLWAAPLVAGGVTAAGFLFALLELPAVIGAGAAAGALVSYTLPWDTDWLDLINTGLGVLTGSAVGLFLAASALPATLPASVLAIVTASVVGVVGVVGLLPMAVRFDTRSGVPSRREIRNALKTPYRPPVFRAIDLYADATKHDADIHSRQGLVEVTTWIFHLQVTLQSLDGELENIRESDIRDRIAKCYDTEDADEFTCERRLATAVHLERLLEHRTTMATERRRNDALVDYAVAFLEESRAGLAMARELPGEAIPDRLPEVLNRLRQQATSGDARRKTAREMDKIERSTSA
ncbi:MAG: hypothetical protein GWP91_01760 [Rhodobacterales bacterium]|nr:hypothetical protein [Rhodobacterales bacterium]